MTAQRETSPIFVVFLGSRSVCASFHFFGQSARSPFLSALASVRPLSPSTGTAATAATAAADDSIDKGWTTGRRTNGTRRAVLALPGCRKLFKSPSCTALGLSKTFFARRCRVLDKVRILAQYQGVLNLQSLQFMEL